MTDAVARRTILVAEDNAISRELLKFQLEVLGFDVLVTEDGEQALQAWREGDFAMLFTDVQMPNLGGYELAATIRAERPADDMPIVILTAGGEDAQAKHGTTSCVDAVLVKPASLSALRSVIARGLDAARSRGTNVTTGPSAPP